MPCMHRRGRWSLLRPALLNILRRFENSALPNLKNLVNDIDEWFLYPVYLLPPDGKWSIDRVMLLGDAAHAVSGSFSRFGVANLSRCH
jgi:2-polyprenyl-6-methoxyphenol hydroxylase-like FAD-dependent oxidoreductase